MCYAEKIGITALIRIHLTQIWALYLTVQKCNSGKRSYERICGQKVAFVEIMPMV